MYDIRLIIVHRLLISFIVFYMELFTTRPSIEEAAHKLFGYNREKLYSGYVKERGEKKEVINFRTG